MAIARYWPLLLALGSTGADAIGAGSFTVVETGKRYADLQSAVSSVRMGTATILIAPGVYRQCAVQAGGRITYKAATPGSVIFERMVCEDKAALVLRGAAATVDGLVFRGYRVRDGNGAGIRSETGDLTVVRSSFLDSQEGIAGGQPAAQRIVIDQSNFAGLGQCDEAPNCSHSIYLGNRGQVSVTRSRFARGTGGHYIKLRSPNVTITDNSFDDRAGAKTNYMIDLPEGATGTIARNMFVQGPRKENGSAMVVVGAEAKTYRSAGLRIEGNEAVLAARATSRPAFVVDFSHERLAIGRNRLGAGVRGFELR
jgi:hypothetical protein